MKGQEFYFLQACPLVFHPSTGGFCLRVRWFTSLPRGGKVDAKCSFARYHRWRNEKSKVVSLYIKKFVYLCGG